MLLDKWFRFSTPSLRLIPTKGEKSETFTDLALAANEDHPLKGNDDK